jgi:hypothetical protein
VLKSASEKPVLSDLALLIDAQGTWSGGMYLWIFEEITGGPVLMLRGWRAEQPLFPEQNLS